MRFFAVIAGSSVEEGKKLEDQTETLESKILMVRSFFPKYLTIMSGQSNPRGIRKCQDPEEQ
jgi:hypothetical protein